MGLIAESVIKRVMPMHVLKVYQSSADGVPQRDIPEKVGEHWLTAHAVGALLHRKAPFESPDYYDSIDQNLNDMVTRRFKKYHGRKTKNGDARAKKELALLTKVLESKAEYERSIGDALAAGFSEDDLRAWVDLSLKMEVRV